MSAFIIKFMGKMHANSFWEKPFHTTISVMRTKQKSLFQLYNLSLLSAEGDIAGILCSTCMEGLLQDITSPSKISGLV